MGRAQKFEDPGCILLLLYDHNLEILITHQKHYNFEIVRSL
jgi:hypothetical protein